VRRALVVLVLLLSAAPAAAQDPGPPPVRGYVIDVRGATSNLPNDVAFFPGIPVDTVVPARGYGFEAGGHVYLFGLGPARVGAGASYTQVRGTAPGIVANLDTLAPQVSFNFGTANGWSYLSAGFGVASVTTEVEQETGTASSDTDWLTAINYGGGARWFLTRRIGVGFDVRFHRVSGPPKATQFAASVGFSVR
jgi:hypothetical protein